MGRWVDRMLAGLYRRGQSIVEGESRVAEERRAAIRAVRDALSQAMVSAEEDREQGSVEDRSAAVASANRASAVAQELADGQARRLVLAWK